MRRTAAAALTAALALLMAGSPALPVHGAASPADQDAQVAGAVPGSPAGSPDGSPELDAAAALLGDGPVGDDASAVEPTLLLRDLYLARPGMEGRQRRAADGLLARPTIPGKDSYASYAPGAPTEQRCGPRVCVTFVTAGADRAEEAWALRTLGTVEDAWTRQVDEMGFRPPPGDGTAGGDARFDVYLANVSAQGFYGYCVPEEKVPGQPGRAQSYCVLDNDMAGFSRTPLASLAVTAAHEFFHAIQFNIDVREDQWWMEASATWIEEQVAGGVDDNRQFLRAGQLGRPGVPLDSFSNDLAMYGNWIFVQRLAQTLGTDAVRRVWERLDASVGAPDEYSVQGLRNHLSSRGMRWGSFYARFVEANLTPRRSYPEGRAYQKSPLGERLRVRPGQPPHRLSVAVPHLAAHTVQLRAGADLPTRSRLRVRVTARRPRPATPVVRLLVFRKGGRTNRLDIPLDRRGSGARTVSLRRGEVRRVVLVLANASTRFRRCGTSGTWSCGGQPVDDRQRFQVVARAVR